MAKSDSIDSPLRVLPVCPPTALTACSFSVQRWHPAGHHGKGLCVCMCVVCVCVCVCVCPITQTSGLDWGDLRQFISQHETQTRTHRLSLSLSHTHTLQIKNLSLSRTLHTFMLSLLIFRSSQLNFVYSAQYHKSQSVQHTTPSVIEQSVRPELHNLLSPMETWKRTGHTNTQEPIPAGIERKAGYTLDRLPVNYRADT